MSGLPLVARVLLRATGPRVREYLAGDLEESCAAVRHADDEGQPVRDAGAIRSRAPRMRRCRRGTASKSVEKCPCAPAPT
jgi:hypothetical protein